MMRRSVRILVLLLTVAVTAGVIWRATVNEQARGRMRLSAQQHDAIAADALFELSDLRATFHAFVAPGQGDAFWSQRARAQIQSIRGRLGELERASAEANHPPAAALTSLDALVEAERRVQANVRDAQPLLAGDIIFTEVRDLIDGAARDLSDTRQAMARASSAREAGAANEQSLLAGALIAVWIFALVVLVPVPSGPAVAAVPAVTPPAAPLPAGSLSLRGSATGAEALASSVSTTAPTAGPAAGAPPEPPSAPAAAAPPVTATADLASLAALCADLGRVEDASALGPLLERTAGLIGARGLVVWLVAEDGRHLVPAIAHGYDQKVLARMGAIPVDDHNLTAAAFRTHQPTRVPAQGEAAGALAVPMLAASGASGVVAAEVPGDADLDRATAVAGVVAAQLASLFPATASETAETTG